ncbi:MAG TPA: gliding motility-associated C-terminal domain-containing protein [Flavobacterium sp.]|jgi:gliding motility-associated-like protein
MRLRCAGFANFWSSLLILILLAVTHIGRAQPGCAGSDGEITICDYANPANQTVNLFSLLGGSPTPGGTWSDPAQTGALNPQTGILDVWDIHTSNVFVFTYTVNVSGCVDTATVTVTIGGFSGIGNAANSACDNDNSVNLFQFFVTDLPNPHQNGVWTNDDTGFTVGSIFNAMAAGVGTYNFTYTMPAIGSCPAVSTSIAVTVYRSPQSGTRIDLLFCNTDDFSTATNVNLFDHLVNEDPNGQWTENLTDELDSPFDSFIDVQNIFNTYGVGTYSFSYTVYPPHPVCTPRTTVVRLFIEEFFDFTGATLTVNSDICQSQIPTATYTAVITPGVAPIPAGGPYLVSYEITSSQPTVFGAASVSYNNGFTFNINPAFFSSIGTYNVTITNIRKVSDHGACENIIDASDQVHIYPDPDIANANLSFSPMCQNVDGNVQISGNTNIGTGTYQITYSLSGSNIAVDQTAIITATAGTASVTLPGSWLQNLGQTTFTISSIVNTATGCSRTVNLTNNFIVNGISITTLTVTAADACSNDQVVVSVSGLGSLTAATITYNLTGANTATNETVITPVSSGTASFSIPAALLQNSGTTTFTITYVTDNITTCGTAIIAPGTPFTTHPVPAAPVASDAVFCSGDIPIIADLVPVGNQYNWYDSATATTPLQLNVLLSPGHYFVSETLGQCESDRTEISVTVVSVEQLILIPGGDDFCGADNPTLQDLSDNIQVENVLVWYDAAENGNVLPASTPLQDNVTYYGVNALPGSPCASPVLGIRVSLDECDDTNYDIFIPDGFSPNGDNVNDVFRIPDIQFTFPDYTLEIYNRYGNLMFRADRTKPAWDGRDSQADNLIDGIAANGVYFYVLYYNKNNAPPRQGQLYLNR